MLVYLSRKAAHLQGKVSAAYHLVTPGFAQVSVSVSVSCLSTGCAVHAAPTVADPQPPLGCSLGFIHPCGGGVMIYSFIRKRPKGVGQRHREPFARPI